MKNGKVTFADFKKFMEFLGLWEEYKKEVRLNGRKISDVKKHKHSDYYISDFVDMDESDRGIWFWASVDSMWYIYLSLKETEKQK